MLLTLLQVNVNLLKELLVSRETIKDNVLNVLRGTILMQIRTVNKLMIIAKISTMTRKNVPDVMKGSI